MVKAATRTGIKTCSHCHNEIRFKQQKLLRRRFSLVGLTSIRKSSRVRRKSAGARPQTTEVDWNHVVDIKKK
jgi:hypothetical protein